MRRPFSQIESKTRQRCRKPSSQRKSAMHDVDADQSPFRHFQSALRLMSSNTPTKTFSGGIFLRLGAAVHGHHWGGPQEGNQASNSDDHHTPEVAPGRVMKANHSPYGKLDADQAGGDSPASRPACVLPDAPAGHNVDHSQSRKVCKKKAVTLNIIVTKFIQPPNNTAKFPDQHQSADPENPPHGFSNIQ